MLVGGCELAKIASQFKSNFEGRLPGIDVVPVEISDQSTWLIHLHPITHRVVKGSGEASI